MARVFEFGATLPNEVREQKKQALISIRVSFRDPQSNLADVDNPRARVLREGEVVLNLQLVSGTLAEGGSVILEHLGTGRYSISFLPSFMEFGLYRIEFTGDLTYQGRNLKILIGGVIEIGEITMLQYYITQLRIRLMDDLVSWYRLDEPVFQWPTDTLMTCLANALDHIVIRGPQYRPLSFDTVPEDLITTGGLIYALESRARMEIANAMSYTDGHSLSIDRGPRYQALASQLRQSWDQAIEGWKKATPPQPIGLKSQRLPFRIFRVIGLIPGYQSYFEGVMS